MNKSISITVRGKVQGVFFRASTKEKADELGVKGFVCNQPDGSVYMEAEGEENTLEKLIEWCNRGPRLAHVTECMVKTIERKNFTKFEIQR